MRREHGVKWKGKAIKEEDQGREERNEEKGSKGESLIERVAVEMQ
jgi:hypothetical protein